jgi:hypothetical protein
VRGDRAADPDPDGVALAAATTAGVLLGAHLPPTPWFPAAACLTALCLAATCLATAHPSHLSHHPSAPPGPGGGTPPDPLSRPSAPPGDGRPPLAPGWPAALPGPRAEARLPSGWSPTVPGLRDKVPPSPVRRPAGPFEETGPRLRARASPSPVGRPAGRAVGTGWSRPGGRGGGGQGAAAGLLVLLTLLVTGAAVAGVRAAAVRGGVLAALAGRPETVEVAATVAEEPRPLAWGGRWVVLSVRNVTAGGRVWRTRERAGSTLPASAGRLGVGDRLWLRAEVGRARLADRLGHRPAVVLTRPLVQARAPPSSPVLRVSEAVREAARRRALASLPPDRAGLLVGMALGDTSLLPSDLEQAFRAAGLTHLMAVSGANLAVVLAAGLWLAGVLGLERPALAAAGVVMVVLLVVLTRWEPSVLRAGVMATLVLNSVKLVLYSLHLHNSTMTQVRGVIPCGRTSYGRGSHATEDTYED